MLKSALIRLTYKKKLTHIIMILKENIMKAYVQCT